MCICCLQLFNDKFDFVFLKWLQFVSEAIGFRAMLEEENSALEAFEKVTKCDFLQLQKIFSLVGFHRRRPQRSINRINHICLAVKHT